MYKTPRYFIDIFQGFFLATLIAAAYCFIVLLTITVSTGTHIYFFLFALVTYRKSLAVYQYTVSNKKLCETLLFHSFRKSYHYRKAFDSLFVLLWARYDHKPVVQTSFFFFYK